MKLFHYYHIYADGSWLPPLAEHIEALKKYDLLKNLEEIKIGIVGEEQERNFIKEWLTNKNVNYNVVAEDGIGWEQVTLNKLYEDSTKLDGYVLYAHTKGSANRSNPENSLWRKTMCYYNVVKWKDCIDSLKDNDACGIFWINTNGLEDHPEHKNSKWFFAGNYWWTSMSHIKTLPPPLNNNRYEAEGWVGMSKKEMSVKDFAPGWNQERKNGNNPYVTLLMHQAYYRGEI